MVKEHVQAGHQFGEAIIKIVAALFLHPYFSFVGFWLIGFGLLLALAPSIGVSDPSLNNLPNWYGWTAAVIPLVLAVLLRRIVRKLMMALFVAACLAAVSYMVYDVTESRKERAVRANAPQADVVPARAPRAPTVKDVQSALNEAARPNITFTAPGSSSPGKMFEGVDLRVCDMSLGGVDVCQRYCATLQVADRPSWCR